MSGERGRVLITGAAGYIGSVLVRRMLAAGNEVTGIDNLSFGGESLLGVIGDRRFRLVAGDLRSDRSVIEAMTGVDRVVHLAAIVGDPACAREPEDAEEINWVATKSLFDRCVASATVRRFVYASTCSNYGKMEGDGYVEEKSPLRPVSLYARQKVRVEEYLMSHNTDDALAATSLRFATAYGISPRPRFDLTVNEFTREVVMGRTLEIFGEQFWRPYCHIEDLARACEVVLGANSDVVAGEVFGVGSTEENYQKATLAELLRELRPDADIRFVRKEEDPRDYRVNFSKIESVLNFKLQRSVPGGIREYADAIETGLISDPDSPKYRNI